ncbi:MAG TPA: cytochrome b N-terminal domain-containing protein [Mycobacteriales bacterium]|jgi:hypothetical protein|nr:cytochrome b N-terminal domain-containing protein [Mycobacteriales bacterium]
MSQLASATHVVAAPVDLNGPGTYLHWSVFEISAANLGVIIAMVLLFVAALGLRFPAGRPVEPAADPAEASLGGGTGPPETGTATSWTGRTRRIALRWLPPDRLLPEHQPSYVASWIYVFGVASLAALVMAILSGALIALGGVDWWHTNSVGHFFNSMHLWSVELFMAFMVVHLWGKFWMAAWRGRRARTWITGVLAFLVSVVECFTGYVSQQNFDSQWIATNGKDAFNAAGVGGFWNVMRFGQMLLWHIVLVPLVLLALVGVHILLVRHRGVVHPFPPRSGRDALGRLIDGGRTRLGRRQVKADDAAEWRGPRRSYDLIREALAATAVVALATVALAAILSSPDKPQITVRQWAAAAPDDFVGTAATELAGTSFSATYGPPYNHGDGAVQGLGVSWQRMAGVLYPVNPQKMFVLDPLRASAGHDPTLHDALVRWDAAPATQRSTWANNYADAAAKKVTFPNGTPTVSPGSYGPVPELMTAELTLARDGALDASLLSGQPFYGTDLTRALLFPADGGYYADQAAAEHLQGTQWGVMNETGSYPGQPWLWLYQLWYHVPGIDANSNIDLIAIYLTGAATVLLLLVPFIPGLRSIPRGIPVYRLIWRHYYRETERR